MTKHQRMGPRQRRFYEVTRFQCDVVEHEGRKEYCLRPLPCIKHGPHPDNCGDGWRDKREAGWQKDIGYLLEDVVRQHIYEVWVPHASDPGLHPCSCKAWHGYYASHASHVADHLRGVAEPYIARMLEVLGDGQSFADIANSHEGRLNRLAALRRDWDGLPVWGPNEYGQHILDDVDREGLLEDFDNAFKKDV